MQLTKYLIINSQFCCFFFFFFFNDTATTEIYTLSLHDALPIFGGTVTVGGMVVSANDIIHADRHGAVDRKSTRLNSSHQIISYAVFCLKKKNCKYLSKDFEGVFRIVFIKVTQNYTFFEKTDAEI